MEDMSIDKLIPEIFKEFEDPQQLSSAGNMYWQFCAVWRAAVWDGMRHHPLHAELEPLGGNQHYGHWGWV